MQSFCGKNKRTNVAAFGCDEARKYPNKLGIGGKTFTEDDAVDNDTFYAALIAATKLDTGDDDKLFFINNILDPQDISEANKTGAVGEGVVQDLVEGRPAFTYRVEIGHDLYKRLRKLNKRRVPVFTYDDFGNLWGCKNTDGNFAGCEAIFFISENRQQTSTAPVSALIKISYISAKVYNDEAFYVPVELGELEPAGLIDGYLREISNVSNVYKIAFEIPTASFGKVINLWEKYNAELVAGLFNARTGVDYATTLALTSVAYDSALKCGTVTFDSTAFTALASGAKIKLYLDPVADLEAADIPGIEGVELIITKA